MFGIKGGTFLVRNEKIRKIFEDFDSKVASGNYIPKARRDQLARVEEVLALDCPVDKDGLTISKKHLAIATNIPVSHLFLEPFKAIILLKEEEIRKEALVSKINPLLGSRRYDFRELVQVGGGDFASGSALAS